MATAALQVASPKDFVSCLDVPRSSRTQNWQLEFKRSTGMSDTSHKIRAYARLNVQLRGACGLKRNWDSYGAPAPNQLSLSLASQLLASLKFETLMPTALVPSAEGGIALYFIANEKTSYIEFRNSGEAISAMYDLESDPVVEEFYPTSDRTNRAIREITNYLAG